MFLQAIFPSGVADGTMITPQLLVGFGNAWVLLVVLLAVCCGILWLLSKPSRAATGTSASSVQSSHTKTKRSGRFRLTPKGKRDLGTLHPVPSLKTPVR